MDFGIFQELLGNGIFAALFVSLLFYVIKENRDREEGYRKIINDTTKEIGEEQKCSTAKLENVSEDIDVIDNKLGNIELKVDNLEKKVDGIDRKFEVLSVRIIDQKGE